MKKIYQILFFTILITDIFANNAGYQQTNLSGKITDTNGKSLTGVTVFFPELKTGAVSDNNGYYLLDNLPKRNMLVQITALGYKMIAENIDLKTIEKKDFVLSESVVEINEVVVTGQSGAEIYSLAFLHYV